MELRRIEFPRYIVREVGYAAGARMERHAHDFGNITAVLTGEVEETTDSAQHRGRSCSVLLKPRGTMHRNVWLGRRGTRCISIEFRFGNDGLTAWRWLEDTEAARAALQLASAVNGLARDRIEAAAEALIATAAGAAASPAAVPPPWVEVVKRAIEARFDQPLRFDRLARDLDLHPVYLSRAFRRYAGTSPHEYVRALRLRHARHLLGATDRPLHAISADAGFADASHLCRVFAEAHGVTPRRFRAMVHSVQRPATARA